VARNALHSHWLVTVHWSLATAFSIYEQHAALQSFEQALPVFIPSQQSLLEQQSMPAAFVSVFLADSQPTNITHAHATNIAERTRFIKILSRID